MLLICRATSGRTGTGVSRRQESAYYARCQFLRHTSAVPVGKLALYTALAGVDPHHTLPITLDTGTDNETLRALPWYTGLRQGRPPREAYDAFIDEFVSAVKARFGPHVLLQVG